MDKLFSSMQEYESTLGIDLNELQLRVLDGKTELSSDDNREVYELLKKKHQVDLNDEANLPLLEDPVLKNHMASARDRLNLFNTQVLNALPLVENLRLQYIKLIGKFSTDLTAVSNNRLEAQGTFDKFQACSMHIEQLLRGEIPHGLELSKPLQKDEQLRNVFNFLIKEIKKITLDYEKHSKDMEVLLDGLFVARREFEQIIDGLFKICQQIDECRRLQREILSLKK
jgi:hypothetical protein